ncbi:MAG: hypothetical protein GY835_01020 [bacterium]|nr:hypothetical protein [bacterium]
MIGGNGPLRRGNSMLVLTLGAILCWLPSQVHAAAAIGFIENQGQMAAAVRYYMPGTRAAVFFTPEAVVIDLKGRDTETEADWRPEQEFVDPEPGPERAASRQRSGCALWVRFEGANPAPVIEVRGELPTRFNYLLGNDPENWRTDVPAFREVVYRDLWPGIDLVYRQEADRLSYELVTKPGANPDRARFVYAGAERVTAAGVGVLHLETTMGLLTDSRPGTDGDAGFLALSADLADAADPSNRDYPAGLLWSTLLGGGDDDRAYAVAITPGGNPVVAGYSYSPEFPTTPGAYQETISGAPDGIVAMLAEDGSTLLWSTFLGGMGSDPIWDLLLTDSGSIMLTGHTYSFDFPTTPGAYSESHNGGLDAFVTMLAASGNSLLWSTFLGGPGNDVGYALGLDSEGNPIITGNAGVAFPTTPGAYDESFNGVQDAFVAKLSAMGSALLWSTLLGGDDWDQSNTLAIDYEGNVLIAGFASSADFPSTAGAFDETFDTTFAGYRDVFVSKLGPAGETLLWSTFLGGSGSEEPGWARSLALDTAGNPIVTGHTNSSDFPTTPGALDTVRDGQDAFIARLSASGTTLLAGTFLGGSGYEGGEAIVLDSAGYLVVTGSTGSADFPTTFGAYDENLDGIGDVFAVRLDDSLIALRWGTYLGGGEGEGGISLALTTAGDPVVAGFTNSTDFPTTPGTHDESYNGGYRDAFVAKLRGNAPRVWYILPDGSGDAPTIQAGIDAAASCDQIIVAPGVYTGSGNKNIEFRGKDFIVRGEGGAEVTIIDCEGSGRGFHIHEGEVALIDGFTIRNGNADRGGGLRLRNVGARLFDMIIVDCRADDAGGGISLSETYCELGELLIARNEAYHGGGISSFDSDIDMHRLSLVENRVTREGSAVWTNGGDVDLTNSIIAFNEGAGAALHAWDSATTWSVACCDVSGNIGGDYGGYLEDHTGIDGCISEPPLFCDQPGGDYSLHVESPCLPVGNDCGVLMGALGQGCDHQLLEIAGTVSYISADPIGGVPITGGPYTVISDPDGTYSIRVTLGWSGTLTPMHPSYTFDPPERTYNNVQSDHLAEDYLGLHTSPIHVPADFATIQEALDYAVDGDTVSLADGTYTGDGNRDLSFRGKAVTVRSSSGDPEACIIDCQGSTNDRHRGFDFGSGEGPESVLEGVTVRNGWMYRGGGIRCRDTSPTIRNCIIADNSAEYPHDDEGHGGGVYLDTAAPRFVSCLIRDNFSDNSGGGIEARHSPAEFIGCTFVGNATQDYGGGINAEGSSCLTVVDCLFTGNSSWGEGGGIRAGASSLIDDCVFRENSCGGGGGGAWLGDAQITGCLFVGNQAYFGGGMASTSFGCRITNCTFVANSAEHGAGLIFFSGADDGGACAGNIIAFNEGGVAILCFDPDGTIPLECCDVFGNEGGDYVDCISSQFGVDGNISADPLFCDAATGDFTLRADSPCAGENNPGCGLIGAAGIGCQYWHVLPDGTGDFPTIQQAINAGADGDVILLADGVFTGDQNRDLKYFGQAITIRSAGGDPAACVIDCEGSQADPHRGLYFYFEDGPAAVLEGVTIRNGWAENGGGVYCREGSAPTIRNCIIEDNHAFGEPGVRGSDVGDGTTLDRHAGPGSGGGICCERSDAVFSDCLIRNNSAEIHGGGIYAESVTSSLLTLSGCRIVDNEAGDLGGGIHVGSACLIAGCRIAGNIAAEKGGGIYCARDVVAEIMTCVIVGNRASYGGGIECHNLSPRIVNCTVADNAASVQGAGIRYRSDSGTGGGVEHCIVAFNGESEGLLCPGEGGALSLLCCNIHGNAGGDYVGCIADRLGVDGNFSADPLFCGVENVDEPYALASYSPCLPEHNDCEVLIGALSVGCDHPFTDAPGMPEVASYRLHQSYPNPFNPLTTIRYDLPEPGRVTLRIYDVAGRLVRTLLMRELKGAGRHEVNWAGRDDSGRTVGSGVYLSRLEVGSYLEAQRMLLMK